MKDQHLRVAGSPLFDAQEQMYAAVDAPDAVDRVALARKALAISPDCTEAYLLLAEEAADGLEEAMEYYRQGVAAGERAIGADKFDDLEGHFWGVVETRPYMRARLALARCLWQKGEAEEAIGHYEAMLRLNPHDNQGVRYDLVGALLALGRDAAAEALLDARTGEDGTVWEYARALLGFRRDGDSPRSRGLRRRALEANPHVPAFLSGERAMPPNPRDKYGFADPDEAVAYVAANGPAWRATAGAVAWLVANGA